MSDPPQLIEMTMQQVGQLDDRTMRNIFQRVIDVGEELGSASGKEFQWLCSFARVLLSAEERNFAHLKLTAMIMLVKYRLPESLNWTFRITERPNS